MAKQLSDRAADAFDEAAQAHPERLGGDCGDPYGKRCGDRELRVLDVALERKIKSDVVVPVFQKIVRALAGNTEKVPPDSLVGQQIEVRQRERSGSFQFSAFDLGVQVQAQRALLDARDACRLP